MSQIGRIPITIPENVEITNMDNNISVKGKLGNLEFKFDSNLNINISENMGSIPMLLFVAFQGTFAAIAVAIVSGSIIERVKFSTWIVFVTFWVILVYCPVAHWIWGGGFLSHNGVLDFAGCTFIHINA